MNPDEYQQKAKEAATRMRAAFFSVFGDPETMDPNDGTLIAHTLAVVHTCELVEWAARFKPETPILRTVELMAKTAIAANEAEIRALRSKIN